MYFASFIFVISLAFFFTKYLAKKSSSLNKGQNAKIIEAISLGNNTRIVITEIFDVIYIVYENNSHLLLLDKLSKEDLNFEAKDLRADKEHLYNIIERAIVEKKKISKKFNKEKGN